MFHSSQLGSSQEVLSSEKRTSTNTSPKKDHFDPKSIGIPSWVLQWAADSSGFGILSSEEQLWQVSEIIPGKLPGRSQNRNAAGCHHQHETHPWEGFIIPDPACMSLGGLFRCLIGAFNAEGPLFLFNNSIPGLPVEMVSLPCALGENPWLLPGQLLPWASSRARTRWIIRIIRVQQNPSLQLLMSKN